MFLQVMQVKKRKHGTIVSPSGNSTEYLPKDVTEQKTVSNTQEMKVLHIYIRSH